MIVNCHTLSINLNIVSIKGPVFLLRCKNLIDLVQINIDNIDINAIYVIVNG